MNKGTIIGIISGLSLFFIIILILFYCNLDFDQQLIQSVDKGTSKNELYSDVLNESSAEKLKAQSHFQSHLIDPNNWQKPSNLSEEDYVYYKQIYLEQLNTIEKIEETRKKFVNREISKEELLSQVSSLKSRL